MKYKNIVYWLLGVFIFVGWSDLVWGNSIYKDPISKTEDQRKQKRKKKKRVVKKKVVTTTVKKNKNTKKKRVEKTKGSSRVKAPIIIAPPPNFNNISKTDFITGKHKRLVIPYIDGGKVKWGVGRYKSGRYIIVRDIGINADGTTYDYWKSK